MQNELVNKWICEVIDSEICELESGKLRAMPGLAKAIELIQANPNSEVKVMGIGKSGIIAKKIAATFCSTGTRSSYIHPTEALHGDLGAISQNDIVIIISYSGETEELALLIPYFKDNGIKTVSMTGNPRSRLGQATDVTVNINVTKEACYNNLAPTSSTTLTLVCGDALCITLARLRGFQPSQFAKYHPGGSLGRKMQRKVSEICVRPTKMFCDPDDDIKIIAESIDKSGVGAILVKTGLSNHIFSIITDGDLRRALMSQGSDCQNICGKHLMQGNPISIDGSAAVYLAEQMMLQRRVKTLVVKGESGEPIGFVSSHMII